MEYQQLSCTAGNTQGKGRWGGGGLTSLIPQPQLGGEGNTKEKGLEVRGDVTSLMCQPQIGGYGGLTIFISTRVQLSLCINHKRGGWGEFTYSHVNREGASEGFAAFSIPQLERKELE